MSLFSKQLVNHLSNELDCDKEDVENALNSFLPSSKPEKPVKEEVKKSSKNATCERIPRGRTDPCGKGAKNSLIDLEGVERWYCAPCYKCAQNKIQREKEKNASETIAKEAPKPGKKKTTNSTQKERKKEADIKSEVLCRKVTRTNRINAKRYKTKNGTTVFMDRDTRILFEPAKNKGDSPKAYAKLDEDEEIIDLEDKEIRFLEANNVTIKQKKTKKSKKVKNDSDIEGDDGEDSDEDVVEVVKKAKTDIEEEIDSDVEEGEEEEEGEDDEESDDGESEDELDLDDFE